MKIDGNVRNFSDTRARHGTARNGTELTEIYDILTEINTTIPTGGLDMGTLGAVTAIDDFFDRAHEGWTREEPGDGWTRRTQVHYRHGGGWGPPRT